MIISIFTKQFGMFMGYYYIVMSLNTPDTDKITSISYTISIDVVLPSIIIIHKLRSLDAILICNTDIYMI